MWLTGALLAEVAQRGIVNLAKEGGALPSQWEAVLFSGVDWILLALVGVWIGCLSFQMLAILLQGSTGGLALHLSVAGIAAVTSLALAFTRLRAVAAGAGFWWPPSR